MKNLNNKIEIIKMDYSAEKIETAKKKEEYNMIYGIYKKNNNYGV